MADHLLTTHTGSLPRPPEVLELLRTKLEGGALAGPVLDEAVDAVVARQVALGLDLVSDGELGRAAPISCVLERLEGFGGKSSFPSPVDLLELSEAGRRVLRAPPPAPACNGPVRYVGLPSLERELERLRRALGGQPAEAFVTAPSPGAVALFLKNHYYPSRERYLEAIAQALQVEYQAIHAAGFVVEIDAPDLALGRHLEFPNLPLDQFQRNVAQGVEALNAALAGLPPERLRLHLCWGNYAGPHHKDVELRDIIDEVLLARPSGLSFAAATPRHAHEWRVWEDVRIPAGKVLIPGVVDPTSSVVEHPDLVAERLGRFTAIVGLERVIGGTDCGFTSFVGQPHVEPEIAWAKLAALVEGARRVSGLRRVRRPSPRPSAPDLAARP